MTKMRVTADKTTDVSFAPASTRAEILQNLRTILGTVKDSVPLDRAFGVSADYLDQPLPVAQAHMSSEILTAVKRYEPRVQVTGITYTGTEDGRLTPTIEVVINDDDSQ